MGAGRMKMVTLLEHGLDALGWVNAITLLLVFLVGWAAWKKTIASTSQEIYQRVAQAYKAEVEALQERMRLLEQENEGLRHLLETIKRSLARRGLRVTEEGQVKKRASEQAGERVSEDEREQPGDQ
jgi:F0F1-type ATP synthase membrane subunit b/b'